MEKYTLYLFDCKPPLTIEGDLHFFLELIEESRSGAYRLGPHVARENILCGPQCFLGIFR